MTLRPASISSAVATSPASPPPTTMASASISSSPAPVRSSAHARHLRRPQAGRAGASAFRTLDEAGTRSVIGAATPDLVGQRQDRALQVVDLGRAAAAAGPPTSRSAPAGRSPACAAPPVGTAQSGSRRMTGIARGGTPSTRAGVHAGRLQHGQRLLDLRGQQHAASAGRPAPVASGRSDSALSALLRLSSSLPHSTPAMSACSATAAPGTSSASRKPGTPAAISNVPLVARWKRGRSPSSRVCTTLKGTMPATVRCAGAKPRAAEHRRCRRRSAG